MTYIKRRRRITVCTPVFHKCENSYMLQQHVYSHHQAGCKISNKKLENKIQYKSGDELSSLYQCTIHVLLYIKYINP